MTTPGHVVLVGLMGAGKSSVSKLLASKLGIPALDLDEEVERRSSASITELFDDRGEAGFRVLELDTLADVLADPSPSVVATGGGVVTTEQGRALLRAQVAVVFLDVDPAEAARRVGDARSRPLLAGDPEGRLRSLAAERRSLYLDVADIVVDTSERSPGAVVGAILDGLGLAS